MSLTDDGMEFKNILVAYDSSAFSNRAFKKTLDFAESGKSKITIVTVVTGIYQPSIGFSIKYAGNVLEDHRKLIKKAFERLKPMANKRGIKLSLTILHNPSVSNAILNYVNSHKYDLIVIGSHGRTGLKKAILGSVANEVSNKAKIPVMVVK